MRPSLARSRYGVALAASLSVGCATTYPADRYDGRISLIHDGLHLQFYKNGGTYDAGDVRGLVAADPRATDEATTFETESTVATWLLYGGLAAYLAATFLYIPAATHDESAVPAYVGGGAAAGLIIGAVIVAVSARSHLFDAIKIFNDGLPENRGGGAATSAR
jgi:hypothetical protein